MPGFRTVLAVTGAALLVRRAVRRRMGHAPLWPMPALDTPISGRPRGRAQLLTVAGRTVVADGVVRLRLEPRAGAELPPWEPGAHLDLVLPSGAVRQYSLCGDPADRSAYTVATRLIEDGRGGSREVHEQLAEGTGIEVRGPRNRFPLVSSHAYVFVAGGIGITPILPMLRAAQAAGAEWRLVYAGRTRASMPFLDEVERIGGAGRVTVLAEDETGRPDPAALFDGIPPAAAVYCCGPEGLMDAVAAALPTGSTLHLERFTPAAATEGNAPFELELRRSRTTVTVAADETALTAVRRELPDIAYSCAQGFCGTCQQRVVAGEVEHRDELLTDEERRDSMLICVSRARGGKLTLDL
ncbi:PDR/VanB family oxidoreductase [Streptomyces boluensis]|uniref:2Fe-2S iron-sulfur cluster binding domain-containing protein n=1 Tax=Streptomyces boluensis TaxID=1775135 RepID=A0A964UQ02_9ACTN|nr:PDR/VanB family oxidoreductase [Streptomyces boluensis]NBE53194.1 2Fe-2S iron-sulfur cluster binding domain-containing protein [Streptomyces boluensis]